MTEVMTDQALLEVSDLDVVIDGEHGRRYVLQSVSLSVPRGARVGVVGESGSGKTMTARATIGLLPHGSRVTAGRVRLGDRELVGLPEHELRHLRGTEVGMTFQNAKACLDPLVPVGAQIAGVYRQHHPDVTRRQARDRAIEALDEMGIADARRRARSYAHEFSGGMAQRVMIALALVCSPRLLIADEPTTGLDVTVEEQVLRVISETVDAVGASLLFISHDLRVIAHMCAEVVVMYGGTVVEQGPTETILREPAHPYTQGLVASAQISESSRMATIPGRASAPLSPHVACPFADRCPAVMDICRESMPQMRAIAHGHAAACYLVED